jgi:hypothetical protein
MDDRQAQSLQKQAIEALSLLRAWIWTRQETLLPDDLSGVTREQAARYAAYLEWDTTVDIAMQALTAAAPTFGDAPRASSRSGVWHRTIAVSALAAEHPGARGAERAVAARNAA